MLPLLLHPAFAATWVVDPSGGGDFLSITAAVEAASDGDELQLAAASFVEDVALGGKSLTLTGAGSGTTWIFGTGTTIDARGAAEVTLSGLTLYGGTRGIDADGALHLEDVFIEGAGGLETEGGAVRMSAGTLDWTTGGVTDTVASHGALAATGADISLVDVDFSTGNAEGGAALYLVDSALGLTGGVLSANEASGSGGAIWSQGGSLTLTDTTLYASSSNATGGCLAGEGTEVSLVAVTVQDCLATESGGGLWLLGGALSVVDSVFLDNSAPSAADITTRSAPVTLRSSTFSGGTGGTSDCAHDSAIYLDLRDTDGILEGVSVVGGGSLRCGALMARDATSLTVGDLVVTDGVPGYPTVYLNGQSVATSGSWSTDDRIAVVGPMAEAPPLSLAGTGSVSFESFGALDALSSDLPQVSFVGYEGMISLTNATFSNTLVEALGLVEFSDSAWTGGGLVAGHDRSSDLVSLSRVRFVDARPEAQNGAITLDHGALSADRVRVEGSQGAGLVQKGGVLSVSGGWFGDNGGADGGAIAQLGGALLVRSTVFFANEADRGGAIFAAGDALEVDGVVFQENMADEGSALYVGSGAVELRQITTVGGAAREDSGSFGFGDAFGSVTDTIVAETLGGAGLHAASPLAESASSLRFNDGWANEGGDYGGTLTDRTGADGNLAEDPLFVAFTANGDQRDDDLHLGAGSPSLDAGYPDWTDPDGSRADIGAFGGDFGAAIDYDGDFVLASEGDCNDADADVYPGAPEVADDGVDQDCDGADLVENPGDTGDTGVEDSGSETAEPGETGGGGSGAGGNGPTEAGCACGHGAGSGVWAFPASMLWMAGRRRRR